MRDNLNSLKAGAFDNLTLYARTTPVAAPGGGLSPVTWETNYADDWTASGTSAVWIVLPTAGRWSCTANFYLSGATGSGGGHVRISRYNSAVALQEVVAEGFAGLNGSVSMAGELVSTAVNDRLYVEATTDATGTQHSWAGRFSVRRRQLI